jgi:homoserine dehydrogenase
MKQVNVGVVGFGTVGAGVVECLLKNGELIAERTGVKPVVKRIADLDITSDRGVEVAPGVLTTNVADVLAADDIDVVVELVGGTTIAKTFVLQALANGKPVVTANKALLAHHGEEIFAAAEASGADVYYEASVAGGIPVIKALREGLVGNRIEEIVGILNGTCNYILTRMVKEGLAFETVLKAAQEAGYAEAEPSLDIDGVDTAHKATILASLAFGEWFGMEPMHVEGVRGMALKDIQYAESLGYKIKLLAVIKQKDDKVQMRVHPALVSNESLLGHVDGVFNAVWIKGDTVDGTLYYGRGAGREATASAVVADIVDVGLNLKRSSTRRISAFRAHRGYERLMPMSEIESRYYLRLQVRNNSGVMAAISGALGRANISIASVSQKENAQESVPVVLLTYTAKEGDMQTAMAELRQLPDMLEEPVMIRIEDLA